METNQKKRITRIILIGALVVLGIVAVVTGRGWSEESYGPTEWVVYGSNRTGSSNVWLTSLDGKKEINLTKDKGDSGAPRFSPDGTRIVFSSNRDGDWEIYTMARDGSDVRRLTTDPAADESSVFTPDGEQILFSRADRTSSDIWIMNADGTSPKPLTSKQGFNWRPRVSADGRKVVFQSKRDGQNNEIYIMNLDGAEQRRLTTNPAFDGFPSFLPDGRIVFTSTRDAEFGSNAEQIYVMNQDGSGVVALTEARVPNRGCNLKENWNFQPSISADGTRIVFLSTVSMRSCGTEIFVMDADGKNWRQVTAIGGPWSKRINSPNLSPVPFSITVR